MIRKQNTQVSIKESIGKEPLGLLRDNELSKRVYRWSNKDDTRRESKRRDMKLRRRL